MNRRTLVVFCSRRSRRSKYDHVGPGVERAKTPASALICHTIVLLFPGRDVDVDLDFEESGSGSPHGRFATDPLE
jgi:hypothetical protein